ncbi:GH20646 [Drosophila grimshawi]|uniref:GH20646 n=1 Tax=Drosophila grimshawi TaxID=7222 RepID=B4JRG2_DROGR|nr:GH20646 [Drosophila grimshawi]
MMQSDSTQSKDCVNIKTSSANPRLWHLVWVWVSVCVRVRVRVVFRLLLGRGSISKPLPMGGASAS